MSTFPRRGLLQDLCRPSRTPRQSFQMTTPDSRTALSYAIRVPRGVIAVVCRQNLPLLLATWKVGPALACATPWSSSRRRRRRARRPCWAR
jgi:acyl-CoA reductase-like NAD-dependent aldehyde dehydrogenase